jgi:hypothetical protein
MPSAWRRAEHEGRAVKRQMSRLADPVHMVMGSSRVHMAGQKNKKGEQHE